MRTEKGNYSGSTGMPGSYPHAGGNSAQGSGVKLYGVPEGKAR